MSDVVGTWEIPANGGLHLVQFEHGTTSGKRVIRVDGKEIYRADWMFKLVGEEEFTIGNAKCIIYINANSPFTYEYIMEVNGKSLEKFLEQQSKIMKSWTHYLDGTDVRVVLEKDTLDVWVNGQVVETNDSFVEGGSEMQFQVFSHDACIKATSSGKRKIGIVHKLYIDNIEIPVASEC